MNGTEHRTAHALRLAHRIGAWANAYRDGTLPDADNHAEFFPDGPGNYIHMDGRIMDWARHNWKDAP